MKSHSYWFFITQGNRREQPVLDFCQLNCGSIICPVVIQQVDVTNPYETRVRLPPSYVRSTKASFNFLHWRFLHPFQTSFHISQWMKNKFQTHLKLIYFICSTKDIWSPEKGQGLHKKGFSYDFVEWDLPLILMEDTNRRTKRVWEHSSNMIS